MTTHGIGVSRSPRYIDHSGLYVRAAWHHTCPHIRSWLCWPLSSAWPRESSCVLPQFYPPGSPIALEIRAISVADRCKMESEAHRAGRPEGIRRRLRLPIAPAISRSLRRRARLSPLPGTQLTRVSLPTPRPRNSTLVVLSRIASSPP